METIFDFNPTDKEIEMQFGYVMDKEKYLKTFIKTSVHIIHLYELFNNRGDKKTAKKYADMIPYSEFKVFELLNEDF